MVILSDNLGLQIFLIPKERSNMGELRGLGYKREFNQRLQH